MTPRPGFDALLAQARRRCRPGRTSWIGVDGLGGSGKTTLASRLAAGLDEAVAIHLDDFARLGIATWDHDLFVRQVLTPLHAGRPARYRRWDHRADSGLDWTDVPPGIPVIAEGVSATDIALPVPWDLTVWVDAPEPVRLRRIADRDGTELAERWRSDWLPQEERYFAAQRPDLRADVVVSGA